MPVCLCFFNTDTAVFKACCLYRLQPTSLSSRAHEGEGPSEDAVEDWVSQVQLLWPRLPLPPGNHSCYPTRTSGCWTGARLAVVEPVALLVITWSRDDSVWSLVHERWYRCIYCGIQLFGNTCVSCCVETASTINICNLRCLMAAIVTGTHFDIPPNVEVPHVTQLYTCVHTPT